jgi:hypothetical protein
VDGAFVASPAVIDQGSPSSLVDAREAQQPMHLYGSVDERELPAHLAALVDVGTTTCTGPTATA